MDDGEEDGAGESAALVQHDVRQGRGEDCGGVSPQGESCPGYFSRDSGKCQLLIGQYKTIFTSDLSILNNTDF